MNKTKYNSMSEDRYGEWHDTKGYPYLYIDQSLSTFSKMFKDVSKRPDFLVFINSIGIIAVDVKDRSINRDYETFGLNEENDIQKLMSFERIFRIPVWFALSSDSSSYRTLYWISLTEVVEKVQCLENKSNEEYFRAEPYDLLKTIGWEDGLSKLFGFATK